MATAYSVIVYIEDDNLIILAEGNHKELSNIIDIVKNEFDNAKLIDIDKESYNIAKNDIIALRELIQPLLQ